MENSVESNIQNNLVELRKSKNLKQSDLAEKIGYSDKTISRWENGSTVPDIVCLCKLADFYGVTVDDLTKSNAINIASTSNVNVKRDERINALVMLCLSIITIWGIAIMVYVGLQIIYKITFWQIYVIAVPVSTFLPYRFNRRHDRIKWLNTLFLSVILWSFTASVYLVYLSFNLWQLFLLPIPVEAMIVVYTLFGTLSEEKKGIFGEKKQ